jgi:hypothetical protein
MSPLEFCESFIRLANKPFSFGDRPYLPAIYAAGQGNLVLRCSRQTEKSTFLVNTILYAACRQPGIQMLFVTPRQEQVRLFSRLRLLDCIEHSPLLRRHLLGQTRKQPQVMNLVFRNGSRLFVRAAYHSGDACRGISADLLLVDEFQDIADGDLPVLQETLSHAAHPRTILTGTPKSIDNHLEAVFRQSTANEWIIDCAPCGQGVILDERCLGPQSCVCPQCQQAIDPRQGRWVARHPDATWGAGFWVNHLMVPWLQYDEILNRQRAYDLPRFKNEVLGLATTTGEHAVTRAELEACCTMQPMANTRHDLPANAAKHLVAGIDWGGGSTSRTVLVLGYLNRDFRFHVVRFERFAANADPTAILAAIAERCAQFRPRWIAADGGGNGHVYNRLLLDRLARREGFFAILYSASDQPPWRDGVLWKWTVCRSASIGTLISRIKTQRLSFPRVSDSGTYLEEFAGEVAEYDSHARTVRYSHPDSQPDDALHATNYALLAATYTQHLSL